MRTSAPAFFELTGKFCSTRWKRLKPTSSQAASVSRETARTKGTKTPPSRSASFWTGA